MALQGSGQAPRDNGAVVSHNDENITGALALAVEPRCSSRRASLKSGKASSITGGRRKSHECALAVRGLRLKSES